MYPNIRLWYSPEIKGFWGWKPICAAQADEEYARMELNAFIRKRDEANRPHTTNYYDRNGKGV